jgi:hypothetical protein
MELARFIKAMALKPSTCDSYVSRLFIVLLALASRCLVLMYKVAICHPSTLCCAISGTLFPISGGRPALPVPSPAAISLFPLL